MKFIRIFKNEKGLTLVELLSTIALLSIVGILIYSFLFQGLNSDTKTSDKNLLNQKGNLLMNEIRAAYNDGQSDLCFEDFGNNITVSDYQITNGDTSLSIENNCILGVDGQKPLEVELTLANKSNQTLTLDAAWENSSPEEMTIVVSTPDEDDDGDIENPNELDWETVDALPCLDNKEYQNKNIKWTSKDLEKNCAKHEGENSHKHGTFKSLWITTHADVQNNTIIDVGNNLYMDKHAKLQDNASIKIGKNLDISGHLDMQDQSKLSIGRHAFFHGKTELEDKGANLSVGGNATFDKKVEAQNQSMITIDGKGTFKGKVELEDRATVEVGKNGIFHEKLEMQDNSTLSIDGNSIFRKMLDLQGHASINISGDGTFMKKLEAQDSASISIKGNATFKEKVPEKYICVNGTVTPKLNIHACK